MNKKHQPQQPLYFIILADYTTFGTKNRVVVLDNKE